MKKTVFSLSLLFLTFSVIAQIEKGDILVKVNGNYTQILAGSNNSYNSAYSKNRSGNIGTSIGYLISNNYVLGVGLDYGWNKQLGKNYLYLNNYAQLGYTETKSREIIPFIYFGYYHNISDKLVINADMEIRCGAIKSEFNSLVVGAYNYTTDSIYYYPYIRPSISSNYTIENESRTDVFGIALNPEITYYLTKNIGLTLCIGGIEYEMYDWETDNSIWDVNFHPKNWEFGVKIRL
jgi:hypothetical protein